MNLLQRNALLIAILILTIIILLSVRHYRQDDELSMHEQKLLQNVRKLEEIVAKDDEKIDQFRNKLNEASFRHKFDRRNVDSRISEWTEPIPVLVFVCNRANAIKNHLEKLIRFRKSAESSPIIVTHDCSDSLVSTAVRKFGTNITYLQHNTTDLFVPASHKRYAAYYKIANHYKLGLQYVFNKLNYSSVIITEDDLDVSEDFFEYFKATRPLLEVDRTLYCVSAWNDNGKANLTDSNAPDLLYRSDFFPGLGWMLTRDLWREFENSWPKGFWDDWIREPEQRQNRSCIRPEISRTSMTLYGKVGASKGRFFNRHLKYIVLNKKPVEFSKMNLDHLLKTVYDEKLHAEVYLLPLITILQFLNECVFNQNSTQNCGKSRAYRIKYETMEEYTRIAKQLQIMHDTKAGVPRTAYMGIVSCFISGIRLYIAPANPSTWNGYLRHWEAPANLIDY